jgi:tetratricopeptide (TPR) repeat protein/serine/threonine protein kinase
MRISRPDVALACKGGRDPPGAPNVNEQTLFAEALERVDPQERAAFLDRACQGDPALRARIERLLVQHEHGGGFLESPPVPLTAAIDEPATERRGTAIGPYKLLEPIGEGGMGTVWMAQQTEPVKRLVAVKLIKAGMDSKQVIARFEAERQALALMDHPNIAKVLDAGTTGAGRPYFVMDLVKGAPITRYCDEHRLPPRQRLELFLPVCQAVQHAHQKGVIHRDLKPSNVLVALYDGRPAPKVIDFGVAKAAGQALTDKTLVTGFGAIVGTLEYLSPEQAESNQLDIDTRSDVYSLGVLLYELLAGSPPFTRKEQKGGLLEMLRLIREQEPTRPSARLSAAEGLPTLAANRGMEPAKLTRLVRGELDWIVTKALEKDRNRRYETASGFALDVQHYLADEPVLACPPSAGYRLRKFARRNKRMLVTGALVGVMLMVAVGAVTSSIGWIVRDREAREEETARRAREALTRARVLVRENKVALARQVLTEAMQHHGNDRAALGSLAEEIGGLEAELGKLENFLGLVDQARLPPLSTGSRGATTTDFVDRSAPDQLPPFRWIGASTPTLQVLACYGVMERPDWLVALEGGLLTPVQQRQVRRVVYEELLLLAADLVNQGHRSRQELSPKDAARKALAYLEKAETAFRLTRSFYRIRARCRRALGHEGAARQDEARALQTPATIAWDHYLLGLAAHDAGDKAEAVKQFEAALRVEPTDYMSLLWLGACQGNLGREEKDFVASAMAFTGCIMKRPAHAFPHACRGMAYLQLGRKEEALADLTRFSELDGGTPQASNARAVVFLARGRPAEALVEFTKAIELDPKYLEAWHWRGVAYGKLNQPGKAVADFSRAIELDPKSAPAWGSRGVAHWELGQLEKALADLTRAIELDPKSAPAWTNRGLTHAKLRQWDKALADYARALELDPKFAPAWTSRGELHQKRNELGKALADYTRAIELGPKSATAWNNRGFAYSLLGQRDKAIGDFTRAIELDPKLAPAWSHRGCVYSERGQPDKARADCSRATELAPDKPVVWRNWALVYGNLGELDKALASSTRAIKLDPKEARSWNGRGDVYARLGQPDKAIADFSKAIELDPNDASAWYNRGVTYKELGRLEKALADYTRAIELDPKDAKARCNRGAVYAGLRELGKALADHTKAVELAPREALCWNNRAQVYFWLGQLDKALADYTRAIALNPKDATAWHSWHGRGMVHSKKGQWEKAVADFSGALERNAKAPGARIGRGAAYAALGQWEKAIADLAPTEDRAKLSLQTGLRLASLNLLAGESERYQELCRGLAPLVGRSKDADVVSIIARTCTLSRESPIKPARAVRWAEQTVKAKATAPYLHSLGRAHYRAGQFDQAIRRCLKSLQVDPSWQGKVLNWLLLAMAEQRLGRLKEAQEWLNQAAQWRDRFPQNKEKTVVCPADLPVTDWLEFHVLFREARALVQGPGKK